MNLFTYLFGNDNCYIPFLFLFFLRLIRCMLTVLMDEIISFSKLYYRSSKSEQKKDNRYIYLFKVKDYSYKDCSDKELINKWLAKKEEVDLIYRQLNNVNLIDTELNVKIFKKLIELHELALEIKKINK